METDYSKKALMNFIDVASKQGLANPATAKAWRIASGKLLEDLSGNEEADVRTIDLDIITRKYANRHPGALSPESLRTYRYRVETAIQEFVTWVENPTSYKPRGSNGKSRKVETKGFTSPKRQETANRSSSEAHRDTPSSVSGLPLSYPIRPDFLAQVVVPRDLTSEEAKRLCAFVRTLAIDFKPSEH